MRGSRRCIGKGHRKSLGPFSIFNNNLTQRCTTRGELLTNKMLDRRRVLLQEDMLREIDCVGLNVARRNEK